MLKHILVPLDGSTLAESALPAAVMLAEKLRARVTLIHVIEKDAPEEIHGQTHLKNAEEATAYLDKIAQKWFPVDIPIEYHVHSTHVDSVTLSLVEHTEELDNDLVIMCSHGRGKTLRLFLGTMAQNVISLGTRPVLIAPTIAKGTPTPFHCRSIMIPLDGNPDHEPAIASATELARACGATLDLVTVIPRFGSLSGQGTVTSRYLPGTTVKMLDLSVAHAEAYLQTQQQKLQQQNVASHIHILRGDPAKAIADAARKTDVGMIILASHGKSGMDAFWAGSVAHRVCSQCRVPLLLIPIEKP